jgi:hypothetical protein
LLLVCFGGLSPLAAALEDLAGLSIEKLDALSAAPELLGTPYCPGQMTYDLRRLRCHGLIQRLPRTNRYVLTPDGRVSAKCRSVGFTGL